MLQNITFKDVQKVILQSRLYEAGRGNGQFATINNFEIENVSINSKDKIKNNVKGPRYSCTDLSAFHPIFVTWFSVVFGDQVIT